MFQRDYILRMIEMMGDLARRVAELMEQLEYLHLLDEESRLNCGMPLKALEELSENSLMEMLAPEPLLYASELLYLRAMEPSMQWDDRDRILLKSLRLLASLTGESILCELRAPRLKECKAAVLPLLNSDDLLQCARFFSEAGCFDEMEDALFQGLERISNPIRATALAAEGQAMLLAAAKAPQEALAYCRMTEQELLEAAGELLRQAENTGV